jgi:hypothetical protein
MQNCQRKRKEHMNRLNIGKLPKKFVLSAERTKIYQMSNEKVGWKYEPRLIFDKNKNKNNKKKSLLKKLHFIYPGMLEIITLKSGVVIILMY